MGGESLKKRKGNVPTWWADAKLGIFIHWVPASVPGFAPTSQGIKELLVSDTPNPLSETPYSEWYQNSLRFPESSVSAFHLARYGDRPYEEFVGDFVAGTGQWDPVEWAARFSETGAGYVVLVTKHHDGWCLWPSDVTNPHRAKWHSERDLVGELAVAVRATGMRFGMYYSGGYDWTFDDTPIGTFSDGLAAIPRGDYVEYATAQVRELIDRYRPSVLWNDIAWPSTHAQLAELFAYYFERVPDGVVNDRWMTSPDLSPLLRVPGVRRGIESIAKKSVRRQGLVPPKPKFFQFRTPEFTVQPVIDLQPWEVTRGMDAGFGYNRSSTESDFLDADELVASLVDTVAKGGNLLLNVGPRGEDAQIPDEQLRRLTVLADWMGTNGTALVGNRPWVVPTATSPEGLGLHFTARGERVWAMVDRHVTRGATPVTLPMLATVRTVVTDAAGEALAFEATAAGICVALPGIEHAGTPLVPITAIAVDHVSALPGTGCQG